MILALIDTSYGNSLQTLDKATTTGLANHFLEKTIKKKLYPPYGFRGEYPFLKYKFEIRFLSFYQETLF